MRAVREIAQVFEQQIELGVFKPGNARVLARIFCGTLWQTAFLECVLRDHAMAIAPPNFIEEFTTMLFHGVKTPDPIRLSE